VYPQRPKDNEDKNTAQAACFQVVCAVLLWSRKVQHFLIYKVLAYTVACHSRQEETALWQRGDKRGRRMLTALEYLGSVGIGVTSPQLFRANDDKIYVVKLQNNCMGTKVLINEYVACWFGVHLELCFPPGDLIEIDEQVLRKKRRLKVAGVKRGPHFASQYIHSNRYVSKHDLQKAVNKQAMAGVMLFDQMFHNVDRTKNRKNLLVRREDSAEVLYAIDNSHLFIRGRWNVQSLEKLADRIIINRWRSYGWLLKHFLAPQDFAPYVSKVKNISLGQLTQLVQSIPQEWLPSDQERVALLGYMVTRCNMIDDIVSALCQSIPDIHRSTYFYQGK